MYRETKELTTTEVHISPYHELAEAIRRGCKLRPIQAVGYADDGIAACAMGAATAGGYTFPACITRNLPCPECNYKIIQGPGWERFYKTIQGPGWERFLVIHLNDVHHWTREAIADYLDTL